MSKRLFTGISLSIVLVSMAWFASSIESVQPNYVDGAFNLGDWHSWDGRYGYDTYRTNYRAAHHMDRDAWIDHRGYGDPNRYREGRYGRDGRTNDWDRDHMYNGGYEGSYDEHDRGYGDWERDRYLPDERYYPYMRYPDWKEEYIDLDRMNYGRNYANDKIYETHPVTMVTDS